MRAAPPECRALTAYFALTYFALAANVAAYLRAAPPADLLGGLFAAAVCLTYPALYLLPVALLVWAARAALGPSRAVAAGAVAGATLVQLWIAGDRWLFQLYGFHLNGFVWNLVTTRGGLESLGAGSDAWLWTAAE